MNNSKFNGALRHAQILFGESDVRWMILQLPELKNFEVHSSLQDVKNNSWVITIEDEKPRLLIKKVGSVYSMDTLDKDGTSLDNMRSTTNPYVFFHFASDAIKAL